VLVKEALKADEKTGTEAFGVGEELVTAAPLKGVGEGKGGKPIPLPLHACPPAASPRYPYLVPHAF
jgi:hypothetical protein